MLRTHFSSLIRETNGRGLGKYKREAMCVYRNIERRWCKQRCSGKAMITAYYECVFVALVIQHALRMQHMVMWLAWLCKRCPHYIEKGKIFENHLLNIKVFRLSVQLLV